ncbi:MAG: RecQ family ATP-dependent DNA helicase, partial [Bacteroidales bacterium]|nr:RecQ family ATP-dependent DNA helicase [Bacteroidales bacterium]
MNYLDILKQYWGYDSFRDLQEDIIESVCQGKDTLGLMPTGGGKSITFQVPALAMDGVCIVITPLIALMKDQVQHLRERNILAAAIYSGMSHKEILTALENCVYGNYKFLYVSPERIGTELFIAKVKAMKVCLITVDESHCISQWGYDFRPSYLKIADIRHILRGVPVLALTATATPAVVKDIQEKLEFDKENVFSMSFERKNLAYVVRNAEDKKGELLHILESLPGCAIVYVRNRNKTKEIADDLNRKDITATYYHAGMDNAVKDLRQKKWQSGEYRVIVATNAFGMGIDKPDVRLVVHIDLPDSPEAYFQEAGRAGRDGKKAYAVALYSSHDKTTLVKRIADTFPPKDYIYKVYEDLQYYYQIAVGDGEGRMLEFNLEDFCRRFKFFPVPADSALKILSQAGYIEYTEAQDNSSRLLFIIGREELYMLHEMGEQSDKLIQTILRSYTGIFTDYTFISETTLAMRCGMTTDQVYHLLVMFVRRGIVSYIPHKKIPHIIYTLPRIEQKRLGIPKEVYEVRRERFEKRIKAMIEYATSDNNCRSRMLLRYFGEKNEHNCGICDVCLQKKKKSSTLSTSEYKNIQKEIMHLLAEQPLTTDALRKKLPDISKEKLVSVVRYLLDEGYIL